MLKASCLFTINHSVFTPCKLNFMTSASNNAGKIWRQSVGLSKLQTARGPLIDLPDYSFTDGRPVPLSVGQVKRKKLQEKLASEIFDGLNYINEAKNILKKESAKK